MPRAETHEGGNPERRDAVKTKKNKLINGIPEGEFKKRQRAAYFRLRKIGELENAQKWLRKEPPPREWTGTPLEYAEEEMPCGFFGGIIRFFGG